MTAPPRRQRLHGLDAMRGIAAICVVLFHVLLRYPSFMRGQLMGPEPLFPGFTQGDAGIVPVLWFFLISGFVIAWTVDRCRTPMDFVVSRVSRIYPAYWTGILVSAAIALAAPLPGFAFSPVQVMANATMLQSYLGIPHVSGVYWSLAVELLFYIYALALFASGLWPRAHLVAGAWVAVSLAAMVATRAGVAVPWRVTQLLLLTYAPFLAGGMMLYRLWQRQTPALSAAVLALCGAATLLAYPPVPAATCFVAAGLIAWSAQGGLAWLAAPPLVWLGGVSYALYLTHEQVSYVVIRAVDAQGGPHLAGVVAAIVVSLLLAWGITRGIEQPAMRAIRAAWRRIRPEPRAPAAAPEARPAAPGSPG